MGMGIYHRVLNFSSFTGDVVFYHDHTGMPKRKLEGTEFPPEPK